MGKRYGARILLYLSLVLLLSACGASRVGTKDGAPDSRSSHSHALIDHAQSYLGTPYQWGGTSKKGIDCSGLIKRSFDAIDLSVPRVTADLVKIGKKIHIKDLVPGDLVFFKTGKSRKKVNHVGLVTNNRNTEVSFIHASTSKGVMISKLVEPYWLAHFITARRILK